ncbi:Tetrahydroberberine oxidase [Bertholletia excelsa]
MRLTRQRWRQVSTTGIWIRLCRYFVVLLLASSSWAAPETTCGSFVACFFNHTSPSSSIIYCANDRSYGTVLQSYIRNRRFNRSTTPKPAIIITPTDPAHVQSTVLCSKILGLQLRIRSGGHDYEGISYVSDVPFIILDMFNLRSISIDTRTQTGWVQSGATLGEFYYKIASTNRLLGFAGGVCPTVAIGGHISGGGYGNMLRKYGLAVDNVVDAQIVDANGQVLDRFAMGEDLFWAILGGGGASFGVVLSYKVKLVPVPEIVTVFRVERTLEENATDIVHKWQFVADKIDNGLFIRVLLQPVTLKEDEKTIRASFISMFLGSSQRLLEVMENGFPELALKREDVTEMGWIESVLYWGNFDNVTSLESLLHRSPDSVYFLKRKSDYVQAPISKDGLQGIWKKMMELDKTGLVFNPYGGKMSEISESATAFPHRAGNIFKIQYSVNWNEEGIEAEEKYLNQIRTLHSYMTPFVSKSPRSAFLNYRDLDIGITHNGKGSYSEAKVYGVKYFKGNFDRLVKVKTRVDPDNFFRNEQSIPPFRGGTEESSNRVSMLYHCSGFLVITLIMLP